MAGEKRTPSDQGSWSPIVQGPGWGARQGVVFAPAQRASPRAGLLVREYESPWQDLLPWAGVFRGEATWVPAQVSHQGEWVSAQKVVPGTRTCVALPQGSGVSRDLCFLPCCVYHLNVLQ